MMPQLRKRLDGEQILLLEGGDACRTAEGADQGEGDQIIARGGGEHGARLQENPAHPAAGEHLFIE